MSTADLPKLGERRLMRVRASFELLAMMMQEGYQADGVECIEGLPDGAVFVGMMTDGQRSEVVFLFSHPSFPVVEMGAMIPETRVTWRTWRVDMLDEARRVIDALLAVVPAPGDHADHSQEWAWNELSEEAGQVAIAAAEQARSFLRDIHRSGRNA